MQEYNREYPLFSLCGLNCGLCPRLQTEGTSKCPGCGGPDFHLKHPTCAVITCNKKHDNVEFCFQCSEYPCEKYEKPSAVDSFISYKNVFSDFKAAKNDIDRYKSILNEKIQILEFLLANYNDGRKKNYYCIAVNLLNLETLKLIIEYIEENVATQDIDFKSKIKLIVNLFEEKAQEEGLEIRLRK
jgi:hypothetical protein